eukprot:snap_masked-scaffold_31-processed-gene-2.18-mRNA-1 protein AED:1.00 eAED:1.00 QI:0/-1/0/0/-1/1/1/0/114
MFFPTASPSVSPTTSLTVSATANPTQFPTSFAQIVCEEKPDDSTIYIFCTPNNFVIVYQPSGAAGLNQCSGGCNCPDEQFFKAADILTYVLTRIVQPKLILKSSLVCILRSLLD